MRNNAFAVFIMKKIDGTLVILTFNEIEGAKALFSRIPAGKINDVFVVDGGSKDGTIDFFRKKGLRVYTQEIKGRGEAFRIGIEHAKSEYVVFFSPDGNEDPDDIVKLLELLHQGYDIAGASRFMKGGRADDETETVPVRSIGNRVFTMLIDLIWGGKLSDSINGFKGITKSAYRELNPNAPGFAIEFQLSIRALKKRMRIAEIPTYEGDRIGGESTAKTISTGLLLLKIVIRELLGKRADLFPFLSIKRKEITKKEF